LTNNNFRHGNSIVKYSKYAIPNISALDSPEDEDSSNFDDNELLQEDPDGFPLRNLRQMISISGIVQNILFGTKRALVPRITYIRCLCVINRAILDSPC